MYIAISSYKKHTHEIAKLILNMYILYAAMYINPLTYYCSLSGNMKQEFYVIFSNNIIVFQMIFGFSNSEEHAIS
jgi:hypothetical protein